MKKKILYWMLGLLLFCGWADLVWGQDATDKNFKEKTSKGFAVVKFTSKWQGSDIDSSVLEEVKGYEDAKIFIVKQEDTKKICKKLRLRNFPSVVLFHNGKKKETWKADMDGEIEIETSDIKSAINDAMAGDMY